MDLRVIFQQLFQLLVDLFGQVGGCPLRPIRNVQIIRLCKPVRQWKISDHKLLPRLVQRRMLLDGLDDLRWVLLEQSVRFLLLLSWVLVELVVRIDFFVCCLPYLLDLVLPIIDLCVSFEEGRMLPADWVVLIATFLNLITWAGCLHSGGWRFSTFRFVCQPRRRLRGRTLASEAALGCFLIRTCDTSSLGSVATSISSWTDLWRASQQ